jgi:hypothetical protein
MKNIILGLLISFAFLSCDKYKAKRLSGIYSCAVNFHYFDMTGTTIDTLYTEDLEVKQDNDSIVIFNNKVHVDELRNGATFQKNNGATSYYKVKIDKGELYYFSTNGGLGGSSSIEYIGKKK